MSKVTYSSGQILPFIHLGGWMCNPYCVKPLFQQELSDRPTIFYTIYLIPVSQLLNRLVNLEIIVT